jgi:hypothetical protein
MKKELPPDFCAAVAKLSAAGWNDVQIIKHFNSEEAKKTVRRRQGRTSVPKDKDSNKGRNLIKDALEQARNSGFLTTPKLDMEACLASNVSEEQIDAVIFGGDLTTGLKRRSTCLQAIHIFYPKGDYADLSFDGRLVEYAPFAARYLIAIMNRTHCRTIGVSWGLSPHVVIDALAQQPLNSSAVREVFPICGFPLHKLQRGRAANENAARLHEALNGLEVPFEYTNQLMPALIPTGAEEQFRRLFEEYSPGYKKALGSGPIGQRSGGLVANVDMILTSISTKNALGELLEEEVHEWAEIESREALLKRVDGDIAGVLLRKKQGRDLRLDEFDRHWTGITRNDIERCAQRAIPGAKIKSQGQQTQDKKRPLPSVFKVKGSEIEDAPQAQGKKLPSPGVCVVAIGANKAAVVLKCLLARHEHKAGETGEMGKTGLISRLICDHDLAMELMKLARAEGIFKPTQAKQTGR